MLHAEYWNNENNGNNGSMFAFVEKCIFVLREKLELEKGARAKQQQDRFVQAAVVWFGVASTSLPAVDWVHHRKFDDFDFLGRQ